MLNLRAVIMAIIALSGCGISLRRPYMGLLMLVVLYFFRPSLWGAEVIVRPVLWLTIAVFLGWAMNRPGPPRAWPLGFVIVLTALYALSTALSPHGSEEGWATVFTLAKVFVVVFLICELCTTPRRLAGVTAAVLLGQLWFVKVAILSWVAVGFSDQVRIDTAVGQGGGSNYIAWMLSTGMGLLLFQLFRGKGRLRPAAAGAVLLWVIAILATGSRGGMLCLGGSVATFMAVMRRFSLMVGTAALGMLFFVFAPQARLERVQTVTLDPKKMDESMLARYQNMQAGLKMMSEYPLFGIGLDSFPKVKHRYLAFHYAGKDTHVAHNTYVQMGAEVGLLFLAVFLLMSLRVIVRTLPLPPAALGPQGVHYMEWVRAGLLSAVTATAIQMAKGDMAKVDYFWWLFALAMSYDQLRRPAAEPALVDMRKPKSRPYAPPWRRKWASAEAET